MNDTSFTSSTANAVGLGPLLRNWRTTRRRSQMDLALEVGVSPRHLSFIETGKSTPSPAMLLALADGLQVPLRERNRLLLAAGYAPRYSERQWGSAEMKQIEAALQRLLDAHQPYPGLVLDRQWNVVRANAAATGLALLLPEALRMPRLNIFRASLHPQGLAAITENFDEWGSYLLGTLQRVLLAAPEAEVEALQREVLQYPNVLRLINGPGYRRDATPALLVPCVLNLPVGRVSLFTTLTTFGTPRDITLDELCVELFYPTEAASDALLRGAAS